VSEIDSAAFLARARLQVGQRIYPQGRCLNFVWRMAGGLSSIGGAIGMLDTAFNSWRAAEDKHHGDRNPPPGVALHYGPSPTRTDVNRNAGDVTVSIGSGLQIATDASGAVVGIMTIAARERQTQRPYLGWAGDLGGHPFTAARKIITPAAVAVAIANQKDEDMRTLLTAKDRGQLMMEGSQPVALGSKEEVEAHLRAGVPVVEVAPSYWDRLNTRAWK
jgi:hypothetical protein